MINRNEIFLLDKEPGKTDAKLRYRVKWSGNTVAFSLGYRVDVDKWSTDTQRCKNNTTHGKKKTPASDINKKINRYASAADEVFKKYEAADNEPTEDQFRIGFNAIIGKKTKAPAIKEKTLFTVLDEFKADAGFTNMWTDDTYEKFDALKNHLISFNPVLSFEDLTEKGLSQFMSHLVTVRDLRNTTALKQLGFLKWFLRWAVKQKHTAEDAFISFSPRLKTVEKKVIFLDWDELMTVYNKEIPDHMPGLSRVRDVFCFCCFTSLRYSDVANLKRSDVFNKYISVTTVKTNDSILIDLNKYSAAILSKYKDQEFTGNLALPVISNQKMNDALKDLGKLCEIDKPITVTYYKGNARFDEVLPKYALLGTHAGRRTFICNALMLGIPPQVVMKWTGHSDYKSMKPYIDVADRAKAEAMKLFDK